MSAQFITPEQEQQMCHKICANDHGKWGHASIDIEQALLELTWLYIKFINITESLEYIYFTNLNNSWRLSDIICIATLYHYILIVRNREYFL